MHILLAEDDEADAILIQRAIRLAGATCKVEVLRDGEEVVRYLSGAGDYSDRESHPMPGLLLLDLKMPKKSGFEVLHWLKSRPDLKRLPVIILSSSTVPSDIRQAYEYHVNSYLAKSEVIGSGVLKDLLKYWIELNEHPIWDDASRN